MCVGSLFLVPFKSRLFPFFTKINSHYNYPTDASCTYVEIGTQRKYRLYVYPALGINRNIGQGPEKLHQALQLIESEFDFKRPYKNDAPTNITLLENKLNNSQ